MKCAKCGAQLKVGCLYCSVCGQEAQFVSDSNLLEEELLRELLQEEKQEKHKKQSPAGTEKKKKKSHKPLIISLFCVFALIAAGVSLILVMNHKNHNSYDYQIQKADAYKEKNNYAKALEYYKRALELWENDIDTRRKMVDIYLDMGEKNSAIQMLHEIISLDPLNQESYALLIGLYKDEKDYEAILDLKESVSDERLLELFSDFSVSPPVFNMKPGTYHDTITITLTAASQSEVYYTMDGSDPAEGGTAYKKPFVLDSPSTLKISAVCRNEYGWYSEPVNGTFTLEYKKPAMPTAIPDSGNFSAPVMIQLTGSEGSRIYYTWDGSEPTIYSEEYTGPILVPEGDNILSVLLIDKHGMASDVLKCNYKYLP